MGVRLAYFHSDERTAALPQWLHRYNGIGPHAGLRAKPPISHLVLSGNNPHETPHLARNTEIPLLWFRGGSSKTPLQGGALNLTI